MLPTHKQGEVTHGLRRVSSSPTESWPRKVGHLLYPVSHLRGQTSLLETSAWISTEGGREVGRTHRRSTQISTSTSAPLSFDPPSRVPPERRFRDHTQGCDSCTVWERTCPGGSTTPGGRTLGRTGDPQPRWESTERIPFERRVRKHIYPKNFRGN